MITPWGEVTDTIPADGAFSLNDIVINGEIIFLTITGPETYYDYHGRGLGTQYLVAEKFAQHLGVSLRVEVCKDSAIVLPIGLTSAHKLCIIFGESIRNRSLLWH